MIKAIETRYNGYRFRSRLEARWAVAFDTFGHDYLYEHEGFDLPSGKYLPDFYFPAFDCWGEVKAGSFTEEERIKCIELAEITRKDCLFLSGLPATTNYWLVDYHHGDETCYYVDCDLWWRPNRLYISTGYVDFPYEKEDGSPLTFETIELSDLIGSCTKPAQAARAARFEFGESG